MNVFLTGGTGFVGTALTKSFVQAGHEVTIVTRSSRSRGGASGPIRYVQGDPSEAGAWQDAAADADVVVNLAGRSIFARWNDRVKAEMRDSRISTTRRVVEALSGSRKRNPFLFSGSAVGYYGDRGEEVLDEGSAPANDFLGELARDWEAEAYRAAQHGVRVVTGRFGIVLGKGGGALAQMVPAFRKFVGGPLGSGNQWFSWIHLDDLCRIPLFLLGRPDLTGPVNCTSPHPLRNKEFARLLGETLHRPAGVSVPKFALKLAMGEFADVLLGGQRVIPRKLLDAGFSFSFPDAGSALRNILAQPR